MVSNKLFFLLTSGSLYNKYSNTYAASIELRPSVLHLLLKTQHHHLKMDTVLINHSLRTISLKVQVNILAYGF